LADLWFPSLNSSFKCLDLDSWFSSDYFSNPDFKSSPSYPTVHGDHYLSMLKVPLFPDKKQKLLLQLWFDDFTIIWNTTNSLLSKSLINKHPDDNNFNPSLYFDFDPADPNSFLSIKNNIIDQINKRKIRVKFKKNLLKLFQTKWTNIRLANKNKKYTKKNFSDMKIEKEQIINTYHEKFKDDMIHLNDENTEKYLNFISLRDNHLKKIKKEICLKNKIPDHVLAEAIDHNRSKYQSAISNFTEGNIDHFRIRPWKLNRRRRILIFEKDFFKGIIKEKTTYNDDENDSQTMKGIKDIIQELFKKYKPYKQKIVNKKDHNKLIMNIFDTIKEEYTNKEIEDTIRNKKLKKKSFAKTLKTFINREIKRIRKEQMNYYVRLCPKTLGNIRCSPMINEIESVDKTSTIIYDKIKKSYMLLIPVKKKIKEFLIKEEMLERTSKKCGADGGVTTFVTVYGEDQVSQLGKNPGNILKKYYRKIDYLNEKRCKMKGKKYDRKMIKAQDSIKNKIADMHWKIAREMCQEYDTIVLGKLSTINIVSKENDLPKIVKRILISLSHGNFRKILTLQGKKYGSEIRIVSEWKTTITCHRCKEENEVGKSRIYICEGCNLEIGRDINASINFYVK